MSILDENLPNFVTDTPKPRSCYCVPWTYFRNLRSNMLHRSTLCNILLRIFLKYVLDSSQKPITSILINFLKYKFLHRIDLKLSALIAKNLYAKKFHLINLDMYEFLNALKGIPYESRVPTSYTCS